MLVHWKVCVLTAVSAGGGVRQTTICTDCSASLVQPTWLLQADLKGKWQWRGGKHKIGQGEKAEEEGYPCCEGRLLMHKNIYTATVSGWQLTAAIMEEPSRVCDTKDQLRTSLVEVSCSFPLKGCTHHPISAPAMLPDPHIILHHHLWHLSFLLPPPTCSSPPQVPKVVGGKGKVYIHQAGSQTQQINCVLLLGPLRVNLAEITGQFKNSGREQEKINYRKIWSYKPHL